MSDLFASTRNRIIAVVIAIIIIVLVVVVINTNNNGNTEPIDETGTELTEEVNDTSPEVEETEEVEAGD